MSALLTPKTFIDITEDFTTASLIILQSVIEDDSILLAEQVRCRIRLSSVSERYVADFDFDFVCEPEKNILDTFN